ncbi:hypothetical protein KC946_01135 [Candidatus Saccharibacteria bacterium]|nr:hypothetical protein [Candidatus Saccharibacteria bacterium]
MTKKIIIVVIVTVAFIATAITSWNLSAANIKHKDVVAYERTDKVFQLIQEGKTEEAYNSMSPEYQGIVSLTEFKNDVGYINKDVKVSNFQYYRGTADNLLQYSLTDKDDNNLGAVTIKSLNAEDGSIVVSSLSVIK